MHIKPPDNTTAAPMDLKDLGLHHDFIKNKSLPHILTLTPSTAASLNSLSPTLPDWYFDATPAQREELDRHHTLSLASLNQIKKIEAKIGNLESFAIPLLTDAIKKEFNVSADVKKNVITQVTRYRVIEEVKSLQTQTLLQAAMHNFESSQAQEGGIAFGSHLWERSSEGEGPAPRVINIEPIHFADLCRRLDIGARYQAHLKSILDPSDTVKRSTLEYQFTHHEKHALMVQADRALIEKHITTATHRRLINLCTSTAPQSLDTPSLSFTHTRLDDIHLTSFIVLASGPEEEVQRCIIYIPGDPLSPVKEYASRSDAHRALLDKLSQEDYRNFFIHLAPQRHKLALKKRLEARFIHGGTDHLLMMEVPINGELFKHLYEQKKNQLFDDACFLAPPTDAIDRIALVDRLEHYLNVGMNVLNVGAFFIPGLGEVMMAVFAAQIMTDVYHGIESWDAGDKEQAWAYTKGVLINLAAVALFSVAPVVDEFVGTVLTPLPIEISPFVEDLDVAELANGDKKLWSPDLQPFEQDVNFAPFTKPDERGLVHHNGKQFLPIEGKNYHVEQLPNGSYRINHPSDPHAYKPALKHNGRAAWRQATEEVLQWDTATLVRRLDTSLAELNNAQTQHLLHLSNTDEAVLRQVHLEVQPPPALLDDSIVRLKIDQDLQRFIKQMRAGDLTADPQTQLQLLTEEDMWPKSKSLRFIDKQGKTISEYGNSHAIQVPTVQVLDVQLREGNLLKTVLECLEENEIKQLLGEAFGTPPSSLEVRTRELRERIAQRAEERINKLFISRYNTLQNKSEPLIKRLQQLSPDLPKAIAEELLEMTTAAEYTRISEGHVPLRVAEEARLYQDEVRLARAYEGLGFDYENNSDTRKLLLHYLEHMTGWSDKVTIEIRDGYFSGPLLDRVGVPDAPIRKVLVKDGNRFKTYSSLQEELHGNDDLYTSILHALPNEQRAALGFPHTWQGRALKSALLDQPELPRKVLRNVLKMPAEPHASSPMKLANGREGYPPQKAEPSRCRRSLAGCFITRPRRIRRLLEALYPTHSEEAVQEFLGVNELYSRAGLDRLERLSEEYRVLEETLDHWVAQAPELISVDENHIQWVREADKRRVATEIKKCWQRKTPRIRDRSGNLLGHRLNLEGLNVGQLPKLTADFSHVSSLRLKSMGLSSFVDEFLIRFPALRWLNLEGSGLRALPEAIGDMRGLTRLHLGNNHIRLTPQTASQLSRMTSLRQLDLTHNPLGITPDVSQLSELHSLTLRDTGITQWPEGITDLPHLNSVDLRENEITELPDSFFQMSAERLRYIQLHDNLLPLETLNAVSELRVRLGLPSEDRLHSRLSPQAKPWLTPGLTASERTEKLTQWDDLRNEPNHEAFFKVITDLQRTPGYQQAHSVLVDRVWRVIGAAAKNTELRNELFAGAVENETCTDRALTVFSQFGFKVRLWEINQLEGASKETEMLKLIKGRVRLQELDDIAQTQIDIQTKIYNHALQDNVLSAFEIQRLKPDPIEVQLIYQVDLAEPLELPWQPTHMTFREMAKILPRQIEDAHQIILNKETTPGFLANKLQENSVWADYLETTYKPQINAENDLLDERYADIETLREKQEQWASSPDSEARTQLETDLKELSHKLGIANEKIFTGKPMTDADYDQELLKIAQHKKDILKGLTQKILDKESAQAIATH